MIRKTISMPDKMGEWIKARVESGQYGNESEYIRDLVRYDQEQQKKRDYLKMRLEEGEAAIARGEYIDLETPEDWDRLFDEIERESEEYFEKEDAA
jgi:antitoxin ParD1/3/4